MSPAASWSLIGMVAVLAAYIGWCVFRWEDDQEEETPARSFTVLRFGDLLEITGECPWCPSEDECHFHYLQMDPFWVDPLIIPVVP